jgi:hypothetical protein
VAFRENDKEAEKPDQESGVNDFEKKFHVVYKITFLRKL